MDFLSRHTKFRLYAATTTLFLPAATAVNAQELVFPDRWTGSIINVRPIYTPDTLTIVVLGDIMMHQNQIDSARKEDRTYDFNSYFSLIGDDIRKADIAVANMEFTLAGEPYTGYPCFSAPDSFADYLAECGFDIFLAANNHIFDKGTAGAERTLKMYRKLQDSYGIRFTGLAGDEGEDEQCNPLFIRRKGIMLALLNFTYGTNMGLKTAWPKTNYSGQRERLGKALEKAGEAGADFTVAFPHWGTEYSLKHSEDQENTAEWLADCGVDWIIGSHPHVVQDCGTVSGIPVVYSLGNAVSNMSAANTQLELMATIRIAREGNGDLRPLPTELKFLWCSRPGGYNDSYTVIPVAEFIGRKEEWKNAADYDNMISTYERVKTETDINE